MKFSAFARAAALVAAIVFVSSPRPAPAAGPNLQPAPFAVPAVGTVIDGKYGSGKVSKVRVEGAGDYFVKVTVLSDNGSADEQRPLCWFCNPTRRPIDLDGYKKIWPLEVGKSTTFVRRAAGGSKKWDHELKVTGTEAIKTAVGPLDTYVVEETVSWSGGSGKMIYWYAPSLNWWVKFAWSTNDGKNGRWEMVGYSASK